MREKHLLLLAVIIGAPTLVVGIAVGHLTGADRTMTVTRTATERLRPSCGPTRYGADGTPGPVLCLIDNPAILPILRRDAPHLFALTGLATLEEVSAAIATDLHHSTLPIMCSAYAAWTNATGWSSGTQMVPYCDPAALTTPG